MTHHSHHNTPPNGFSILELLVAVAVLSIVVVLMAQMLGSASTMISGSSKRMAADEEARLVFDRMAADFSRMVKREDVDSMFVGKVGNDEMFFYTDSPAIYASTTNNSPVAVVGYRVESNSLVRLSEGKNWDDLMFLTIGTTGSTNTNSWIVNHTNSVNRSTIGPSVFRMEYTFLMKPGSTNVLGATNTTNTYSQANVDGMGLKDVSAIVVTLGVLDETSRKIVDSTTLSNVAAGFQDATAGPVATNWSATLPGLSGPARSATRIYQRYIPVNP
jgi:prepilin-type N-terminal cleavage/methylation domain-containing protein